MGVEAFAFNLMPMGLVLAGKLLFRREGLMRPLQGQVVYDEPSVVLGETKIVVEVAPSRDAFLLVEPRLDSWRYRYLKRAFDVVCALGMLVFFAVPGLIIAISIRLTSPYPVFYRE